MPKLSYSKQFKKQFAIWQKSDKNTANKILELINDIASSPYQGLGKPEPLKRNLQGYWSRKINK